MNRVANSRHQLSTLLKQAYDNREALEEQIAQGKRNRKEAGNKYGKDKIVFFGYRCNWMHDTQGFWLLPTCVKRLQEIFSRHAPVFFTLRKATIPTMFSSQHHSWTVWSSTQVPFIVKVRLTNIAFVARYSKWQNWTWGKWNVTDSNNIWAVSGPCTRRSGADLSKKKNQICYMRSYLGTLLLLGSILCRDVYGVHWMSGQNNGKGWSKMAYNWM